MARGPARLVPVSPGVHAAQAIGRIGHHMRRAGMNLLIAPRAAVGLGGSCTRDRLHDPVLAAVVLDTAQTVGNRVRS